MHRWPLFRTLFFVVLCAAAAFAAAKPPFLQAFIATYHIDPNSTLGKTRCLICHQPPGPPRRNPYGLAVQQSLAAANSRMVTAEILKAVESKNDGDGVAFITKIKKDVPPAQTMPKPKPAVQPKPKPKAKAKAKAKARAHGKAKPKARTKAKARTRGKSAVKRKG